MLRLGPLVASKRWALLLSSLACGACAHEGTGDAEMTLPVADAGIVSEAVPPLAACAAVRRPAPHTIADVVAQIDALPAPSIECLVASLPRPLSLVASVGAASLQPSSNFDSPRIFILLEGVTLSVTALGDGASAIELGEWVTPTRTLKGELRFPLSRPVAGHAPYDNLVDPGQSVTSCGFCHPSEEAHATIPGAFVSDALQPAGLNELALDDVEAIHAACEQARVGDAKTPGPHCWLLHALFDYGKVRQGLFGNEVRRGF